MLHIYGIANCDTMKKARHWLDQQGLAYQFHDYKKEALEPDQLRQWVAELGWEQLLNRRGTTWRKLPEDIRERINEASAIEVMLAQPSIIKRPVLDLGNRRLVGFNPDAYATLLER